MTDDDGRTIDTTNITSEVPVALGLWQYFREGDENLVAALAESDGDLSAWLNVLTNNVFLGQAATVNAVAALEREVIDLRRRADAG